MKEVIRKIRTLPACRIIPPLKSDATLLTIDIPTDLKEFFEICDGIVLFENSSYSVKIVGQNDLSNANYKILGADIINAEIKKGAYENEISKDWYIIADLSNSDYIVIDLNPKRFGWCYKAFWDSYPEVGSMTIIAKSFTELLKRLTENNGDYWYFLQEGFNAYGDAYDYI